MKELARVQRSRRDRYRAGSRRTDAQPLRASWRPESDGPDGGKGKDGGRRSSHARRAKRSKLTRIVRAYGWRVYAIPVLLALTALVVVDARTGPTLSGTVADVVAGVEAELERGDNAPPAATEVPVDPVDMDIPTAELPDGGAYSEKGDGSWSLIDGDDAKAGDSGTRYTYTIEVEDGIDSSSYGGDEAFAALVDATLADPRSWAGGGEVRFQRTDDSDDADFRVSLTTPETGREAYLCGYSVRYEASCYRSSERRVVINLARWVRGALAFNHDLGAYRQYLINHEIGHAIGHGHVGCRDDDGLAPVMMQQSFGVANDYVAKLNEVHQVNDGAVEADGNVCRPNSWPNPQATE